MKRNELSVAIDQVKQFLPMYLSQHCQHEVPKGRSFSCINPEHIDKTPSCGWFISSEGTPLFNCFSCGAAGSIFEAAHFIEGKPLSGRGFMMDTLPYLCQSMGVSLPALGELDESGYYEMETFQAYAHAAMVIKHSKKSKLVEGKLAEYGWTSDTLNTIGIGSVTSYEDYMHRMTVHYGHKKEFLHEVDLDRKGIFHENHLIYTIKDEHGSPVGFAARDLMFEEKDKAYRSARAEIEILYAGDERKIKDEVAKLYRPRKYNNSAEESETHPKAKIFHKGQILFNFDQARKATPPLYIFEGQADVTTAFNAGLRNSAGLGSSTFTKEQLELLLRNDPPIKHVIFCLDPDKAGKKGTARAIKTIEEVFSGNVGMQVDVLPMPAGGGDPDKFIRTFGIKSFRELERLDLFSWRMKEAVEGGEDPTEVADRAVGIILNEPNMLRRRQMAKRLASVCCQPEEVVWSEVERRVDVDKAMIEEQKGLVTSRMMNEMRRHPERSAQLIAEANVEIEMIDKQKHGYDARAVVSALTDVYERAALNENRVGLATGWPIFDDKMRGLPKFDKFIALPGKPNHGKSLFLDNMAWRVVEHNPKDTLVVYHTADDSLYERHSRIIASKFEVPSEFFEVPKFYLNHPEKCVEMGCPNFEQVFLQGRAWLDQFMEEERLIVADVNLIAPTFPALGRWVMDLRKRFPDKNILVIEDNFHLLEMPGYDPGEAKVAASSHYIKHLCTQQQVTVVGSMELTKGDMAPGKRGAMDAAKGSSAIPYDINAQWFIYNDVADFPEDAQIRWEDSEHQEAVTSGSGCSYAVNTFKPILELVCNKNKISGWKGTIFFKMWPESGHLEECSATQQQSFGSLVRISSGRAAKCSSRPSVGSIMVN